MYRVDGGNRALSVETTFLFFSFYLKLKQLTTIKILKTIKSRFVFLLFVFY